MRRLTIAATAALQIRAVKYRSNEACFVNIVGEIDLEHIPCMSRRLDIDKSQIEAHRKSPDRPKTKK
jgi:hypothetical protein